MGSSLLRTMLAAILVVLVIIAARPYIEDRLYSATEPRPVEARGNLADFERTTIDIFDRVSPSVVQVVGTADSGNVFQSNRDEGQVQSGTGFVWDGAGHIVTNNHVVQGTTALVVRMASGEVDKASIVGTAPNYDLAVIRVEGAARLPPAIAVGSSSDLKVGQAAFAIGNPFGLDQSLTNGVISALKRRLPASSGREIADVIQTDAAINPGNSGGPLLDSSGRLIGVNTAIYSPSGTSAGIGFAIPVDVVNRVVPELIRNGRVPTPGIGIVAGDEALSARRGVVGVMVIRTVPNSPAARAGLQGVDAANTRNGDVIVAANRMPVRRLSDLTDQLEQIGIGKMIDITIDRNGSQISKSVEITDIGSAP